MQSPIALDVKLSAHMSHIYVAVSVSAPSIAIPQGYVLSPSLATIYMQYNGVTETTPATAAHHIDCIHRIMQRTTRKLDF